MSAGAPVSSDLTLGYSSCPNDTFVFCALATGRIDTGPVRVRPVIEDIESLNRRALRGELDATKVSFHAYARIRDRYALLRAGAALGRGCGPLVVARTPLDPERLRTPGAVRIAIPGELTTAALLLRLFAPAARDFLVCPFDRIFQAIAEGRADAGAIIHEGRFTFAARGLVPVIDLGAWWESETGLPIPLGGIVARRSLGAAGIREVEGWVRSSVRAALADPASAAPYVRAHAREMDEAVVRAHIDLYVNAFTVDLGDEGDRAVAALVRMAEERGAVPPAPAPRSHQEPAG